MEDHSLGNSEVDSFHLVDNPLPADTVVPGLRDAQNRTNIGAPVEAGIAGDHWGTGNRVGDDHMLRLGRRQSRCCWSRGRILEE